MFSFSPLWKLLVDKKMSQTKLREETGFSTRTLAKMNKNEYVSMETLDKICNKLDCKIEDVIEHKK